MTVATTTTRKTPIALRPYALVGGLAAVCIAGLVVSAYFGATGFGLFTLAGAMFGLGTIALVTALGLGYVLFTLRGSLDEVRSMRASLAPRVAKIEQRLLEMAAIPVSAVMLVPTADAFAVTPWVALPEREGPHAQKARGTPIIEIEGIGPTYAARFRENGVNTVGELKAADPRVLAPAVHADLTMFRQWQSMADLMELNSVGKQYSELLARSGVTSVDELAMMDADKLLATIATTQSTTNSGTQRQNAIQGNPIAIERVREWIAEAQRIV